VGVGIWGLRFEVWVEGLLRVEGLWFNVWGFEFRVHGLRFGVKGSFFFFITLKPRVE